MIVEFMMFSIVVLLLLLFASSLMYISTRKSIHMFAIGWACGSLFCVIIKLLDM
jgi:hypothetical protein